MAQNYYQDPLFHFWAIWLIVRQQTAAFNQSKSELPLVFLPISNLLANLRLNITLDTYPKAFLAPNSTRTSFSNTRSISFFSYPGFSTSSWTSWSRRRSHESFHSGVNVMKLFLRHWWCIKISVCFPTSRYEVGLKFASKFKAYVSRTAFGAPI